MFSIVYALGWLLEKLPETIVKGVCYCLGALFFYVPSKRRALIYSNLHHAFPERSPEWLKDAVWRVCQRTVEMGLFTLVCPHFSTKRFGDSLILSKQSETLLRELASQDAPMLIMAPHFSMIETFNACPLVVDFKFPDTAVMYRPHKNKKADAMIKNHRQRGGFKLVAKKEGVRELGVTMRNNGVGILLFDQNTGDIGTLIPFFGRVASVTDLQGILAKKYKPTLVMLGCFRSEFWKSKPVLEVLDCELDPASVTLASNQWLENQMRKSDDHLVDWLWSHNRWKVLHRPHQRLGMEHRKKIEDFKDYPEKKTRIALLVEDVFGCAEQAVPFLKALRESRPDAEITVISKKAERFQADHRLLVDVAHDLYGDGSADRKLAKALRDLYLDVMLVVEDSPEMLKFAKGTKVPHRFGVCVNGKKPSALTHSWKPEDPYHWKMNPEWISFGKHFGLQVGEEDVH